MSPNPQSPIERWLAAESQDRPQAEREAEAALFELFEALPLYAPSAGFADRVLREAGIAPAARRVQGQLFSWPWVRALLAACLGVVALGFLAVPAGLQVLYRLGSLLTVGKVLEGTIRFGSEALVAFAAAVRAGQWMVSVGRALTLPLLTPQASLALLVCVLVSGVSLFTLRDLISRQRSCNYVDS